MRFEPADVTAVFSEAVANEWDLKSKYISRLEGEDNLVKSLVRGEAAKHARPIRVLDVGCGSGKLLDQISTDSPQNVYEGIDGSPDMIGIARSRNWRAGAAPLLSTSMLEDFQCSTPFDLIILKQVLHHVADPAAALTRIHDLLNAQGRCIIMVPSPQHQGDAVPFIEGADPLGRMAYAEVLATAAAAELRLVRSAESVAKARFANLHEYFLHMQSIGSLQKMFSYKQDTAIFRSFLDQFAPQLSVTAPLETVLAYSYYLLERNERYDP